MKKTLYTAGFWIWEALIWGIIVLALFGCTTTKYVPVEKTVEITKEIRDTTVVIQLQQLPGDTVVVAADPKTDTAESHLENKYCESDAVYKDGHLQHTLTMKPGVRDTVRVPQYIKVTEKVKEPQIVEVEKELDFWDKVKYWSQGAFIFLAIFLIASFVNTILKVLKR